MLNQTLFGGREGARVALAEATISLEAGTDWCVSASDCKPWRESEEGIARYKDLKKRYLAQQEKQDGKTLDH